MIIGNWKMNTARTDAVALAKAVATIELPSLDAGWDLPTSVMD